jgi:hypothetical protein
VGDDIVELARDPRPFFGDRRPSLLIALLLKPDRSVRELLDLSLTAMRDLTKEPGAKNHRRTEEHFSCRLHLGNAGCQKPDGNASHH